ncbi:MAG: hypothetical protein HOD60_15075 [Candidatus Nitrosopelagicus sp.]|jgi:hypothetical protein|nr:hypothetical protein [Candidatus Nitrosopelagicus sp.]
MASKHENKVTLTEDNLYLKDFQVDDGEIVSYFQNLNESEDLEEKLLNLLKIGITVTKSISTAENVNYVEKAFDNLDSDFSRKLNEAFGEDGQFSEVIKDHFGEDGKLIKELFNPNREGSPLFILRKELDGNLYEIREKLGINDAVKESEERGTKKGLDFEDECKKKLQWIARIHADKLEVTGNTKGKITGSKKGDFVLTLGDNGKKIVFEMKNMSNIPQKYIYKELKEAIANRESDYGIFVAKNKDSLPENVGWFNEYDGNHLVCAVENNECEAMIDGEIIHIAYKWARAKLRLEDTKEKKVDASKILEKTTEIQEKIGDLRKIKLQCTNIDKSTEAIRETTKDTEKEIKRQLEEIVDSLSE